MSHSIEAATEAYESALRAVVAEHRNHYDGINLGKATSK